MNKLSGILVVKKPKGITSHDVVEIVRRKLKTRKVGHSGTLDPIATGVLILLVGDSTKLFSRFVNFSKAYKATLTLGKTTRTGDAEGEVIKTAGYAHVTREMIERVFEKFCGEIQQVPPMVSALKIKGRRLYKLARQGIEIPRPARTITIEKLLLLEFRPPEVDFLVHCSKGTYVRKLGEDIGRELGCGGYISSIERVQLGPFHIDQAITLEQVDESHIKSWQH